MLILAGSLLFTGCGEPEPAVGKGEESLKTIENWRAALDIAGGEIPFGVELIRAEGMIQSFTIRNGEEAIILKGSLLQHVDDSLFVQFPLFDSEIRTLLTGETMSGIWYNHARGNKNRIPFHAQGSSNQRFHVAQEKTPRNFSGRFKVTFVYEESDTSTALALFEQSVQKLTGTFQTPTGDYRFLEGAVEGDSLFLSCFDGAHAFLFKAKADENGNLTGGFWSGDHWYESWTAVPDSKFILSNPDSLTHMLNPKQKFEVSFQNSQGNLISSADDAYAGEPLIVQIMGTWCPNCKDETDFLQEMYEKYNNRGLQMIAIDFESRPDTATALRNIQRMVDYYNLKYEVLYGGKAGRRTAGAAMPMLNHVMSYPTTIFLDRNHMVQRIYTGFSGPANAAAYAKLTSSFEETIQHLLGDS